MKSGKIWIPVIALFVFGCLQVGCGGAASPDQLADAISDGQTADVKTMLATGIDVNQYSEKHGNDLISVAVWAGNPEIVDLLLQAGADPNGMAESDRKPLITAVKEGYGEIIKKLVSSGADLECRNEYGETPLMVAAEKGNAEITRLLLKLGADPNGTDPQGDNALTMAIKESQREIVTMLIEAGTDVNGEDEYGWTPLMLAGSMLSCPVEIGETLLKSGAAIHKVNKDGNSALYLAAAHANTPYVTLLVNAGSRPDDPNNDDGTPLMAACASHEGDPTGSVAALLNAGADPDPLDDRGWSALSAAAFMGNTGALKLLLDAGVTVDPVDTEGQTPLFLAASNGRLECVKALLAAGANVNVVNAEGQRLLDAARESTMLSAPDIVAVLAAAGAK